MNKYSKQKLAFVAAVISILLFIDYFTYLIFGKVSLVFMSVLSLVLTGMVVWLTYFTGDE